MSPFDSVMIQYDKWLASLGTESVKTDKLTNSFDFETQHIIGNTHMLNGV